jgi:hypothetical protein
MAGIERGGVAARAAWTLIDPDAVERVHISLLPDDVGTEVIRALMIVARRLIRRLAASACIDYPVVQATVWRQLAALPRDNSASESARILMTASDDPELADLVTADMFGNADPADVAFEFGVLINILASGFTEAFGERTPRNYDKIRAWLGA